MKQLATYFGLSYSISWIIWLPLYAPSLGWHDLPTLPFHHGLGGLGPFLAAILVTWMFEGAEGVKRLSRKCRQVQPLRYLAIALASPFVLALVATLMDFFMGHSTVDLSGLLVSREFPQFSIVTFFIYNVVFFGFGEEAGWRGFALPRFQERFSALTSSLILTVFWALWHAPLFLYRPGYVSMDIGGVLGWVFSLLTGSILLTWLYNSSRGSILICAVFHATIDIAFTADLASSSIVNYMGFLITVWGVLTIWLFKPANLSPMMKERVSR